VGLERLLFNVWDEPNYYNWRNSDTQFYQLYDATQQAVQKWQKDNNAKVAFGGLQLSNIDNADGGNPNDPFYIRTPIETWLKRFLELAGKKSWQIDFMDFFKYGFVIPPNDVIESVLEMQNIFDDHNRSDVEFVFNAISHAGERQWSNIDPEEEESALFTLVLTKMLHENTRVNRGGYDFLEDSNSREKNGLLEYRTLRERPRWGAAKKILGYMG
jgi:hypothetical protein